MEQVSQPATTYQETSCRYRARRRCLDWPKIGGEIGRFNAAAYLAVQR
ncbi:MAG TPA: hypothetical protein VN871_09050 [Mycobacterium sp.]|nr:hypothetical protein [Mycobacterium sp.]